MTMPPVSGLVIAQEALEKVAEATDKGEALSKLSKDDSMLKSFADWYDDDPVGFQTVLARVASVGPNKLSQRISDKFSRFVESAANGVGRRSASAPTQLSRVLPHPQGDDLMVPAWYTLDTSGTFSVDRRRGKTLLAHYPIVLEGYVRDQDSGASLVVIAWLANRQWRRMAISRETMGVSSDLARAAGLFGAPIHSANASAIVSYFSAFEALNLPKFEECKGITRMGWTPDMEAFLWGSTLIGKESESEIQNPSTLRDGWGKASCIFLPAGQEVHRVMAGYRRRGTLEGWTEAMMLAAKHPYALVGVYLSLLPPLMQILGSDNLVFEWSGRSSVGKTTALSLSASVWGQPRLNFEPSIVSSWRVTDVYVERLLATLGDLPFYLDDTRTACPFKKNGADPIQVVYDVVAGVTKGRGTLSGTEHKRSWRTVLLTTGEDSITAGSVKGGVFARTWAISAWPWGGTTAETASKVLKMESLLGDHYGHLGPLFVRRVMERKTAWPKWRELYQEIRDRYGVKGVVGDGGGIVGRLGKNLAALELCANIARATVPEVFGTIDIKPMIQELWAWAQIEGSGGDVYQEAAISFRNYLAANQNHFWPRSSTQPLTQGGWWGAWPLPTATRSFPSVFVRSDIMINYLKQLGHANPMTVIKEWEAKKIIRPDKNKTKRGNSRYYGQIKVQVGRAQMWAIEFLPPADTSEEIEAMDNLADEVIDTNLEDENVEPEDLPSDDHAKRRARASAKPKIIPASA